MIGDARERGLRLRLARFDVGRCFPLVFATATRQWYHPYRSRNSAHLPHRDDPSARRVEVEAEAGPVVEREKKRRLSGVAIYSANLPHSASTAAPLMRLEQTTPGWSGVIFFTPAHAAAVRISRVRQFRPLSEGGRVAR